MLQPGTHIGRYEVQRRLGRGGMGTVYVAHDPLLGRMVALKVFQGDLEVMDAPDRFAREARSAASLNHTHIVTVYDYGEFDAQPYIVMEYIQGETLASVIRRKATVEMVTRLRWLEELCTGVAYAHRSGVIHRDIKPGNLMVDRSGRLKVLDFGVARMLGTLSSNGTALIGTPGYMAPEQILGAENDHRADVFSIGVVAYELLSYTQAFPGETLPAVTHRILSEEPTPLAQVSPEVGLAVAAIVQRALKKSAAERFGDADSMAIALRDVRREFSASMTVPTPAPGFVSLESADGGDAKTPKTPGSRGSKPTPASTGQRSREELAKRRAEQIEAAVLKSRTLMESGQLDAALDACLLALTLDEEHPEANALDQVIRRLQTKQKVEEMVQEARHELDHGALTAADGLLQQALVLVPDAPEVRRLERDLRLARVERDGVQQRAQKLRTTVDDAERALAQGQFELAVVLAREALALDPESDQARFIQDEATRWLGHDVAPTMLSPGRPLGSGAARSQPADPPTLPGRMPDGPSKPMSLAPVESTVIRPAVAPTVMLPAAVAPTVMRPAAVVPTAGRPAAPAPTTGAQAARSGGDLRSQARAQLAAAAARLRGLPARQKQIALWTGGAIAVAAIVAVAIGQRNVVSAPVAQGQLAIEAVPWATIVSIAAEDGTPVAVPPGASTPFVIDVPTGTYRVSLIGPPPDSVARVLMVQVEAGGRKDVTAEPFPEVTPEAYFEQYLDVLPVQDAGATSTVPAEASSSPSGLSR